MAKFNRKEREDKLKSRDTSQRTRNGQAPTQLNQTQIFSDVDPMFDNKPITTNQYLLGLKQQTKKLIHHMAKQDGNDFRLTPKMQSLLKSSDSLFQSKKLNVKQEIKSPSVKRSKSKSRERSPKKRKRKD
jgi:hypothetical protein